jgi:acyl carrier protein
MPSIRDEVVQIIIQASKPRQPDLSDENASLLELGLDSLDYASTIMGIEEKYGLQVEEEDMERLTSLREIVEFVEARTVN